MLLWPEERAFLFSQPYRGAVHESVACPCASSSPSFRGVGLRARQRVGRQRSSQKLRVHTRGALVCEHERVRAHACVMAMGTPAVLPEGRRGGQEVGRGRDEGSRRARGPARPRAPRPRGPPAGTRTRRSMAVKTGCGLVARRAALGGRARAVRQRIGLFFRHSFLHEGSVRGAPAACRALSPVKRKAGEGRKVHGRVGRDLRRPWRAAGRDPQPRGGGPWARAV